MGNTNGARSFAGKATAVVTEPAADAATGGWWYGYEGELLRRRRDEEERERKAKKAKKIADKLDRELALAERAIEEEESRKAELARMNRLVAQNRATIEAFGSARLDQAVAEALAEQTFSKMERLERELREIYEEEQFLLEATRIILNA